MISNWDFSLVLAISELLVDPQQPSSLLDTPVLLHSRAAVPPDRPWQV